MVPYRRLIERARETGFCQRLRKNHAVIFLQVLVLPSPLHKHPTVAEIWRRYSDITDSEISYSSFVAIFEDTSQIFLLRVIDECIQSPVPGLSLELSERYREFITIFIQDSSVIRLHEKRAGRFPATHAKRIAAGIKGRYLRECPGKRSTVSIPERTAEIKTIQIGSWVNAANIASILTPTAQTGITHDQISLCIPGQIHASPSNSDSEPLLTTLLRVFPVTPRPSYRRVPHTGTTGTAGNPAGRGSRLPGYGRASPQGSR